MLSRLSVYAIALAVLPMVASAAYFGSGPASADQPALTAGVASQVAAAGGAATAELAARPIPPITTLLAPSAVDQLKADLANIAAQSGGRVGISLQELSGPRRTSLSIGGSQVFYAASAYKLPLLMAEAQQIASGQISAGDVLCYDPEDQEDGWFTDYDIGSCFGRQQLAQRAGLYSDNTAAHILVRYLGGRDALNAFARSIGMTSSALWIPNTTTTDDLATAWVDEALGRAGGDTAQRWLYPLLTHTANESGIPAGLPGNGTVVHKVGSLDGSENDSAYVIVGGVSYVLSVAIDGPDEAAGWQTIASISARIWQYESSRPAYSPAPVTPSAPPPIWPDRRH